MSKTYGPDAPVQCEQVAIAVTASLTSGQAAALKCPAPQGGYILRVLLDRDTATGATATADIGKAANATTSSDTLIDGADFNATGILDSNNDTDNGTNGVAAPIEWGATEYITVSRATGDLENFVGQLIVFWIPKQA